MLDAEEANLKLRQENLALREKVSELERKKQPYIPVMLSRG
jgi:hypothetical protein